MHQNRPLQLLLGIGTWCGPAVVQDQNQVWVCSLKDLDFCIHRVSQSLHNRIVTVSIVGSIACIWDRRNSRAILKQEQTEQGNMRASFIAMSVSSHYGKEAAVLGSPFSTPLLLSRDQSLAARALSRSCKPVVPEATRSSKDRGPGWDTAGSGGNVKT